MSSRLLDPAKLDHAEASLLLPWLGTDRLAPAELEPLLDHLKVCALCRRELRDLAELGRYAELAERAEAPDAAAIEKRLTAVLGRIDSPRASSSSVRSSSVRPAAARAAAAWGWKRVLPFAALALLAVGGWLYQGKDRETRAPLPAGPYTTLSSAAPEGAASRPALRVVVADSCPQAELRRLLLAAEAEIKAGPSRHGVYTVALPAGAAADAIVASWRPLPCFAFVDKAAGS